MLYAPALPDTKGGMWVIWSREISRRQIGKPFLSVERRINAGARSLQGQGGGGEQNARRPETKGSPFRREKAPVFIKHKHLLKVELGRTPSDVISSRIHQILSRQKYEIRKCHRARDEAAEEPRATSCASTSVQLGGLWLNFNTFWAQTLKWCVHTVKNSPSRPNLAVIQYKGCILISLFIALTREAIYFFFWQCATFSLQSRGWKKKKKE